MFLPYQLSQKLHSLFDLLGIRFAVGRANITTRFGGISHESVSRYKSNTLLQTSTHQHIVDVGHPLDFDPDEHPSGGNIPLAEALQVALHGVDGQVTASFVILADETQMVHEFVKAPGLEEVLDDDLKSNR